MECDLFSSLLAGAGARCFDPRTNASGMALFDDRRKKKMEEKAAEEEKGELEITSIERRPAAANKEQKR